MIESEVEGAPQRPKVTTRIWKTGIVQDGRPIWAGICSNTKMDDHHRTDEAICRSAVVPAPNLRGAAKR
jgi:hypothetical protein